MDQSAHDSGSRPGEYDQILELTHREVRIAQRQEKKAVRLRQEAEERERKAMMRDEVAQTTLAEAKRKEKEANKQREMARRKEAEAKGMIEEARRMAHEARGRAREAVREAHEAKLDAEAAKAAQKEARVREERAMVLLNAAMHNFSSSIERAMQPTPEEVEAAKARIQFDPENLHIAIAGAAGSGKSSLINAFCHMKNSNRNAAKTGITETTLQLGRYPDPDQDPPRSRFIWYDVPGTLNVPGWHFNDQALYVFDIILVVTDNQSAKIDVEILRNCRRFNIPSFIIRSKADQHISSLMDDLTDDEEDDDNHNDKPKSTVSKRAKAREMFITSTRKSVAEDLAAAELPPQDVYIVSKQNIYNLTSGSADPPNMINEKDLLRDVLSAACNRENYTVDR